MSRHLNPHTHLCAICNWIPHRCLPQRTASAEARKSNRRCQEWRQHRQKPHRWPAKTENTDFSLHYIIILDGGGRGHISHQGALTRPWQWKVVYTLPKKSQHGHRYSSLNSRMKSASSTRVHININFRKVYALEIQTKNRKNNTLKL